MVYRAMKKCSFRIAMVLCISSILYGESAFQQLLDAGGGAKNVPMPVMPSQNYNQSAPAVQKSAPVKTYRAPSTSAMVGATIFGALLENVLFDTPASQQPDPETLRLQAEQQRQAQEEAARKAKEQQIHHQKLMGSFKSTPSTSTTTEETALAFKSTLMPDAPKIDTRSIEAMRESASRPFDGGATHATFSNHWKPVSLSKTPLSIPKSTPLCTNAKCSWPSKAQTVSTTLPKVQIQPKVVNLSALANPSTPNAKAFIEAILGEFPQKSSTKRYLILNRLSYLTKEIGKELLSSIAMKIIESTPLGDKLSLIKDVHDLAVDDMQNASKVAAWLGSTRLDNPPEITSLSEASKPFLLKSMGTSEAFEDVAELISNTNDVFGLSAKLSAIVKEMP
jgi:hypothetical protein